jgi:hypothetical protein
MAKSEQCVLDFDSGHFSDIGDLTTFFVLEETALMMFSGNLRRR